MGFPKNMAVINQHATAEKRAGEGIFSHFLIPLFMFWLEFKAYGDDHMYCEMQNKLSNTGGVLCLFEQI